MTIYIRLDMDGQFYVEHLVNASRMAKHELSANDTCALNENERKRSTNLVQQVYVEHLENASQRQIVKDFLIKFTKIYKKRCQKHRMAPDTSFDRLHFSVQQIFAEIRIVWQLVDIWLPAPLDFGQFQRIGCFQCMIVACHI